MSVQYRFPSFGVIQRETLAGQWGVVLDQGDFFRRTLIAEMIVQDFHDEFK
jgi:hypothetical protein